MNEKIKALAEKAGFSLYSKTYFENVEIMNKFAELIIQECVDKISNLMDYTDYSDDIEKSIVELKTLRDARDVIKEHFENDKI